ncbi:hypothetical protein BASA81_001187 [Batrachochytrium salamandrivorans]|nr:hypothetical protein BASA81_001187 [Batrachochytrium salamandrivorans]
MALVAVSSMRQALVAGTANVCKLDLSRSPDLVCKNFMCEKMGKSCVCKFARYMEQNEWAGLEELVISGNQITLLPAAAFVPSLRRLDFSNNLLSWMDVEYFKRSPRLEVVVASGNAGLASAEWDSKLRDALPGLKQVVW